MRFCAILCALVIAGLGCEPRGRPIEPNRPRPSAWSSVMARVNGRDIPMRQLNEALVADFGLPIAQQLIADELVRQALEKQKLPHPVTDKEIQAETLRALEQLFPNLADPSPQQQENMLTTLLKQTQNTRRQWDMSMARNARLSRLADKQVQITEKELREEYELRFDGKLKVRHIQFADLPSVQNALKKLHAGEKFETLVKTLSTSPDAKNGGWLADIGTSKNVPHIPANLQNVARALKVGEVSEAVQTGTTFHLLKLEKKIAPQNIKFDDVRESLRPIVRERALRRLGPAIFRKLSADAEIKWIHPALKAQSNQQKSNP